MKRRTLLLLLVFLLVATATVTTLAQAPIFTDRDAVEGNPHQRDIVFVAEQGWFIGKADGRFDPNGNITPAQMATVMERAFPDGMTRAQFASFLRGGDHRARRPPQPPTSAIAAVLERLCCQEEMETSYNPDDWPDYRRYQERDGDSYAIFWLESWPGCKWAYYSTTQPAQCGGEVETFYDLLVPVQEAHRSGAWLWDSSERIPVLQLTGRPTPDYASFSYTGNRQQSFYFNPDNIHVMPAAEKSAKGDRDPTEWAPDDEAVRCRYATDWLEIKNEYDLSVDQAEYETLREMLADCLPALDDPDGWQAKTCSFWARGVGMHGLDRMRAMVLEAGEGYNWGTRDPENTGRPCANQLE